MHIGSIVNFKGKELYINSYEAEYIRGELVFTYSMQKKVLQKLKFGYNVVKANIKRMR